MEEKMKYSTRQQKIILECLQEYGDTFYTIDQFMELLRGKEIQIGRTTVYRGLERLQKEGAVLKVPSVEGAPAQYRFIRDEESGRITVSLCVWNVGIRFLCSVDVSIILWDMCWMNTDLRSIRAGRSFMDIVTAAGGLKNEC